MLRHLQPNLNAQIGALCMLCRTRSYWHFMVQKRFRYSHHQSMIDDGAKEKRGEGDHTYCSVFVVVCSVFSLLFVQFSLLCTRKAVGGREILIFF